MSTVAGDTAIAQQQRQQQVPAARWPFSRRAVERAGDPRTRLRRVLRDEELAGLSFALLARSLASAAIAAWLVAIVPAPRVYYFLGVVAVFFALGLVPHLYRRHRFAGPIKLAFVALDVALIVAVILIPSPFSDVSTAWPVQTRLRFPDYLYLLVYLAGSALSYSPVNVIWTGLCIVSIWGAGFTMIFMREDTVTFADMAARGLDPNNPFDDLKMFISPNYVWWGLLTNQVVLTTIMTGLLAAVVWRARRTLVRRAKAEVAQSDLARYLSPDVAETLASKPGHDFGSPATREVTVLFADLVGFTGLSERLPPERVVTLLRSFQTRATRIIFEHGGTLDKYLGDGLMATFGTLQADPDAPRRAIACAFDLQKEMGRWNTKRAARGAEEIGLGVGLHHGPVVVGNVGTQRRLEFTVIGDPVNVANRLERMTREFGARIAISLATIEAGGGVERLPEVCETRGLTALRGRVEAIEIFVWPPAGTAAAH